MELRPEAQRGYGPEGYHTPEDWSRGQAVDKSLQEPGTGGAFTAVGRRSLGVGDPGLKLIPECGGRPLADLAGGGQKSRQAPGAPPASPTLTGNGKPGGYR
jgi:hypothetical protein